MISVRTSDGLLRHLREASLDGATVADLLFPDGRLAYPGRHDVERELGFPEPYGLSHEARVMDLRPGLPRREICALAGLATDRCMGVDPTLDLLWRAHRSYRMPAEGPSLDRLVASLVAVEALRTGLWEPADEADVWPALHNAAAAVVGWLHSEGLPPTARGLEEICDGAYPACVGLNIIEL